jgi:hypothetical protein
MKVKIGTGNSLSYTTWYEFKKDLEKRLGYSVLNWDWLRVKPKTALPWNSSNMQSTFIKLSRQDYRKNSRRAKKQLVH